jgi:hypothetical protein
MPETAPHPNTAPQQIEYPRWLRRAGIAAVGVLAAAGSLVGINHVTDGTPEAEAAPATWLTPMSHAKFIEPTAMA